MYISTEVAGEEMRKYVYGHSNLNEMDLHWIYFLPTNLYRYQYKRHRNHLLLVCC